MQQDILGVIPEPTLIGRSGRHHQVHPLAWEHACKMLQGVGACYGVISSSYASLLPIH